MYYMINVTLDTLLETSFEREGATLLSYCRLHCAFVLGELFHYFRILKSSTVRTHIDIGDKCCLPRISEHGFVRVPRHPVGFAPDLLVAGLQFIYLSIYIFIHLYIYANIFAPDLLVAGLQSNI